MAYRYNGGITPERMNVFLNMLYGDVPEHLAHIEKYAEDIHAPIMRSQTGHILKYFLKNDGISSVLEIGTAIGYSALYTLWCNENIRIDTIEKVPMRIEDARENFSKYDRDGHITLLEGDAADVLLKLVTENRMYDFVFLDAAKAQYMVYLNHIERLLKPGGILITDNVLQEGEILESRYAVNRRDRTIHTRMREYLKYITDSEKWNTMVIPVGDGISISTRMSEHS